MRRAVRWTVTVVALGLAMALPALLRAEGAPAPQPSPSPAVSEPEPAHPQIPPYHTIYKGSGGEIQIMNRAQFRFINDFPDDQTRLAGTEKAGDSKGSFRVRRAKTELVGWIWNPDLTYELQLSWAGPEPGASTQTPLEDLVLSWAALHDERFHVTFGQFKVPLGRQEMTSSGRLQFLDRDILSFEFTRGRDLGVQLDGKLAKGKLSYYAGVFNGNAASHLGNDNDKYQYNARLVVEPFGSVGYSEGDFESKDKPLVALGVAVEHNDQKGSTQTLVDYKNLIFAFDGVLKYKGLSLFGELFLRDRDPEQGESFSSNGWHVQAGYFVVRDRFEVAGRIAQWDPSELVEGDTQKEYGGAASYYVKKHALKIQGDFRQLENEQRGTKDKELRLQAQLMF